MFWRRKKVDTLKVEEVNDMLVPPSCPELERADLNSELNEAEREEYLRVAKKIGMEDNPAFLAERLRSFLRANEITVYSVESVTKYLNFKYGDEYDKWQWRPLRGGDDQRTNISKNSPHMFPKNGTLVFGVPYFKKIPLGPLLLVEKIVAELPTVGFLVSDERSEVEEIPDPFLAVTVPGTTELLVVDKWDEPGFKP